MADSTDPPVQPPPPTDAEPASTQPPTLEADLDADIEVADPIRPDAMALDGAADGEPPSSATAELDPTAAVPEPRMPAKKDTTLREFMSKMDDYAPIIPDAVTNYYLTKAGLPPPPHTSTHLARLLALATQKFVADIAADAYQYSRIRSNNSNSNNPMGSLGTAAGLTAQGGMAAAPAAGGAPAGKDGATQGGKGGHVLGVQRPGFGGGGQGGGQGRTVLTMEDLGMAVGEYGVNVKRGEFYR